MKIAAHKTFKNKFDQIRAGIKFIYRQNTSVIGYSVFRQTNQNISPPIRTSSFFTLQCKRMYFQSRKLTNIIILFWREIHSFVSINIARALICVYNRIGRTHFCNYQRERNDCSQDWQAVCAIYFSRDQSSDKLINFLDSQLDTRDSRHPRDSILETIEDQVSSLEGLSTCF